MSKPNKQPKAATQAPETAVGAIVKSPTAEAEKPREAKTPRLSPSLKAQADRIIAVRDGKQVPAGRGARPPKVREPQEETVVFAFRLSPEERELIHQAAGPAKASRFVRALAVAAAKRDQAAIHELLATVS